MRQTDPAMVCLSAALIRARWERSMALICKVCDGVKPGTQQRFPNPVQRFRVQEQPSVVTNPNLLPPPKTPAQDHPPTTTTKLCLLAS